MNFWVGIGISTLFLVATIIVFATKFLFPYHRVAAVIIFLLSWIPFYFSIVQRKKWILEHKDMVVSFFSMFWIHIIFGVVMLFILYIILVLFPVAKSPFIGMSDEEISKIIDEDKKIIVYLDQKVSDNLSTAVENKIFDIDFKDISNGEKDELRKFWISYLETLIELDVLKEKYKTFYQLNKDDLHKRAFNNGYTALLAQHYHMFELSNIIQDHNIVTLYNEKLNEQGIPKDTYDNLKDKLIDSGELMRLSAGLAYKKLIWNNDKELGELMEKYSTRDGSSIIDYTKRYAKKPLNFFEKKSFELWFPIQKTVATNVSYIKTTTRDYHIDAESINEYRDELLPGDIMLERREWHATNIGIPGFWTHSALYMGTLDYMNEYFQDEPELNGESFSKYLEKKYPEVFKEMQKKDEDGNNFAVIESKRPGVILMSLENSTHADSVAVLRVKNISKSDRFKIVIQALVHFGKPYDFDFDFVTDNALVCSELVYKAYTDIEKLGVVPQEFNGRLIVSPNQFAEKFANEYESGDTSFELVLFLDGDEKEGVASRKGEKEFATSWLRPKWHIVNDFVSFD